VAKGNLLGSWAFLIGVILAVVLGALGEINTMVVWVLVVLGIIVGLLNIQESEVEAFLMAGAVLVIVSALGSGAMSKVALLERVLNAMLVLFVPATIVVALKSVFSLAKK